MRKKTSVKSTLRQGLGAVLLATVMLITAGGMSATVLAAETTVTATVPVTQVVSGGSGTFNYTLTPKTDEGDANAPMPDGSEEGVFRFSVTGSTTYNLNITGTTSGTWYYALTAADADSDAYSYDVKTYRIGVRIYYDGDELKSEINAIATDPAADLKASQVDFKITYAENTSSSTTETTSTKTTSTTKTTTTTTTTTSSTKTSTVKTGDSSNIELYLGLLIAAAVVLVVMSRRKSRCEF